MSAKIDPNTLSNLEQVTTERLHLDLEVDFENKLLKGSVTLCHVVLQDNVDKVVLDTMTLDIYKAWLVNQHGGETAQDKTELQFKCGKVHHIYGTPLEIELDRKYQKGEKLSIQIAYKTTEKSVALQFLTPEQTSGKKYPFLFTQCQSIYARSMMPCQDSPSIKIAYTGDIKVAKPFTALMSALQTGSEDVDGGENRVFHFEQKIKIPSYLVVVACGVLERHELGPRTAVWSEPDLIEACAYEFADLEKTVSVAEEILTEYEWGRYDLLVLPPAFPYGGMENPCLTFVTPTMIAGDRSLVDLINHELAHSWSGNLVTARSWEHFWLNEGWTTFFEREITGALSGRDTSQLLSVLGLESLGEDVRRMGEKNELTRMVPTLEEVDPDDAFSSVPYERGHNFLYYLMTIFGKDVWSKFLKAYIREFRGRSIDTNDFKGFLYSYMETTLGHDEAREKLDKVDWNGWLYTPGMPPVENKFDMAPQRAAISLAEKWISADNNGNGTDFSQFTKQEFEQLSTQQKLVVIKTLRAHNHDRSTKFSHQMLDAMDGLYSMSYAKNYEIRAAFLYLALECGYKKVFDAAVDVVSSQGRMKFTRPIYRLLYQNDQKLAVDTFLKLEKTYHPICSRMVKKDLNLD